MISKNQIRLITSLLQKKYRKEQQLFLAEGVKVIQELLESNFQLEHLYSTIPLFPEVQATKKTIILESDFKKISALSTPNNCLALFTIPISKKIEEQGLILALDGIRDPGNLGTIIRLCDWFGISDIICSMDTVDAYNPKVVQASMGSITRVNITYMDLEKYLLDTKMPVFGAFMDGQNIYKTSLPSKGIIVVGNEANGISSDVENAIPFKISIPRFGELQLTESLNVAMATSIILSEFRRND